MALGIPSGIVVNASGPLGATFVGAQPVTIYGESGTAMTGNGLNVNITVLSGSTVLAVSGNVVNISGEAISVSGDVIAASSGSTLPVSIVSGMIPKAYLSGGAVTMSGLIFGSGGTGSTTSGLVTTNAVARFRFVVSHIISGGAAMLLKGPVGFPAFNNGGAIPSGALYSFDVNVRSGITYDLLFSSSGTVNYLTVDEISAW